MKITIQVEEGEDDLGQRCSLMQFSLEEFKEWSPLWISQAMKEMLYQAKVESGLSPRAHVP